MPVREGIVWLREDDRGALHLRGNVYVQPDLPLRRRLRLQCREVDFAT
jgi:hypothetical protein